MPTAAVAAAAPVVGSLAGKLIGGGGKTTAQLPNDLGNSRNDTIGLMRYLLGLPGGNQPGRPSSGPGGAVGGAQDYFSMQNGGQPSSLPPQPHLFLPPQGGGLNGPSLQPQSPQNVNFGGQSGMLGTTPQVGGQGGLRAPAPLPDPFGGEPRLNPGQGYSMGAFGQFGNDAVGGGSNAQNIDAPPTPGAPQQRVESVFGPLGTPQTGLQRQATGGISQFLNQPSPETRTLNELSPGLQGLFGQRLGTPGNIGGALDSQLHGQNPLSPELQGILGGQAQGANPLSQQGQTALQGGLSTDLLGGGLRDLLTRMGQSGGAGGTLGGLANGQTVQQGDTSALQRELGFNPNQQFMDALQPRFDQNLAQANQAGGRFGTANAYGRSQAVNDFNLVAAQGLQQDLARRAGLAGSLANANVSNAGQANQTRLGAGQTLGNQQLGAVNALLSGGQASGQLQQGAADLLGRFGQAGIGNQQNAVNALGGFAQQGLGNQQNVGQLLGQLGLGYQGLQQQGQLGAGSLLGQLAGQSGQNDFQRLLGGYGVGQADANQNVQGQNQALAILLQQLGGMQQATLGAPTQTSPSGAAQGAGLGGAVGSILALLGKQGQGQSAPWGGASQAGGLTPAPAGFDPKSVWG